VPAAHCCRRGCVVDQHDCATGPGAAADNLIRDRPYRHQFSADPFCRNYSQRIGEGDLAHLARAPGRRHWLSSRACTRGGGQRAAGHCDSSTDSSAPTRPSSSLRQRISRASSRWRSRPTDAPPRRGALGARTDVGLPAPVRGRGDRPVSVHVAVPAPKRGRNPSRGPANLAATPRRTGHWRTHPARPTRAGCRAGMPAVSRRGRIGAPTDVRWRRPNSRAGAGLSRTAGLPRTPLPRRQPGRGYVVPSSPVWSPLSPRPA